MASVPADGVSPGSAQGTAPRPDAPSMRLGLQSLGGRSAIVGRRLGVVARRVGTFGRMIGVSGATRRSISPGTGPGLEVVRLPEGVWPQPQQPDDPYAALVSADPGMAAIAAMYRRRGAATAQPAVRRGLPSSARRGAVTASGPMTGPTSLARRLQPAEARVRRNESHATEATPSSPTRRPQPAAAAPDAAARRPAAFGESAASGSSNEVVAGRGRPAAAGSSTGRDDLSEVARAADVYARADTADGKAAAFAAAMAKLDGGSPTPSSEGSGRAAPDDGAGAPGAVDRSSFGRRAGEVHQPRPNRFSQPPPDAGSASASAAGSTLLLDRDDAVREPGGERFDVERAPTRAVHRRPVVAGPQWRGGLPALHPTASDAIRRFDSGVAWAAPPPAIGSTTRSPLTFAATDLVGVARRRAVPATSTIAARARSGTGTTLAHGGRVLRPGAVRRVTAPAAEVAAGDLPAVVRPRAVALGSAASSASVQPVGEASAPPAVGMSPPPPGSHRVIAMSPPPAGSRASTPPSPAAPRPAVVQHAPTRSSPARTASGGGQMAQPAVAGTSSGASRRLDQPAGAGTTSGAPGRDRPSAAAGTRFGASGRVDQPAVSGHDLRCSRTGWSAGGSRHDVGCPRRGSFAGGGRHDVGSVGPGR